MLQTPPRHGVGSAGRDDELKQAAACRARQGLAAGALGSHRRWWSARRTSRSTGTRAIRETRARLKVAWAGSSRGRACQVINRQDRWWTAIIDARTQRHIRVQI
jgi:hypothetical protein